ncbi:LuxR family transcriptional regulator [Microbacterium sp. B35-30]|uniref:helix-turn-helix transcriptional regulator n=1 Tax=Microbacterium sp. B35-30 TaxID=1962642 RepID=UPI0013D230CC|nr:LuxR family transcriptional regulator [Microbacterium sp. B35-30]
MRDITTSDRVLGRAEELHTLRALITHARNGVSSAVLVQGDPGVGKTTLIEEVIRDLADVRVPRITGYEVESTLAYGAMQRLGRPLAGYVDDIPPTQQSALRVAAGLAEGPPPERALVGLAVLSVLARAGDDTTTICVVDDAHHLDAESLEVLGVVARRLSAEAVALVFVSREDDGVDRALAGVPRLRLSGLDADTAATVLRASVRAKIDPAVVAEIVSYTAGNPLALRDLGEQLSAHELTSIAIGRAPAPLGPRLEDHYSAQVATLSPATRMWLLLAAAESTGDAGVVRGAASALGLADDAATEAERLRLVEVRERVRFRHPLVRSAVYGGMPDADRRRAHAALRDQTAGRGHRELAAWHAAAACAGTDAAVAEELAVVADLAGARGGTKSRALLLARAAELAPSPRLQSEWLVGAAEAAIAAGAGVLSRQLLERVEPAFLDPIGRGRMLVVEAICTIYLADPTSMRDTPAVLMAAADEFRGRASALEQKTLLLALNSAMSVEDRAVGARVEELAVRMRSAAEGDGSVYAIALRAIASFALDDYVEALPSLREAVAMLEGLDDDVLLDFSFYTVAPCIATWDCDAASRLLSRTVRLGRERGALREVDGALWVLSAVELSRMNPARASEYLAQAEELRRALGYVDEQTVNAAQLAWQGAPRATVEQIIDGMGALGYGGVARMAVGALGIVEIAEGDYASAFERLSHLVEHPFLQASFHHIPELVEAAVRSGNVAAAHTAAASMRRYAAASGSPWARGLAARCDALLAGDGDAEALYLASIGLLDTPSHRGDAARSRLVYGEWLRRMRRRSDARVPLHAAREAFLDVGATGFAERARRELTAAGEQISEPALPMGQLTPQEAEVARLAARGATNADIGSALFISSNTVDYHLRKVFRKLGVSSRRQLTDHFPPR